VEEEAGRLDPAPTEATLAPEQARIGDSVDRGHLLTGQPDTEGRWLRIGVGPPTPPLSAGSWLSTTGYVVLSLHEDPTPNRSGSTEFRHPFATAVDGATGSVALTHTTPDRLPLVDAIGR